MTTGRPADSECSKSGNADDAETAQMDADRDPEKELTQEIINAFFKVYNTLGYGFLESVYQRALAHELRKRGLKVETEYLCEIFYDGIRAGHFRCDMAVERRVIVENKAAERLSEADHNQTLNYVLAAKFKAGLLLHFGPRPAIHRFANTLSKR
jgi:GxxExxY protein